MTYSNTREGQVCYKCGQSWSGFGGECNQCRLNAIQEKMAKDQQANFTNNRTPASSHLNHYNENGFEVYTGYSSNPYPLKRNPIREIVNGLADLAITTAIFIAIVGTFCVGVYVLGKLIISL